MIDECSYIETLLSALPDGELSGDECLLVENHLCGCSRCMAKLEALRLGAQMFAAVRPVSAGSDFDARLARRLKRSRYSPSSLALVRGKIAKLVRAHPLAAVLLLLAFFWLLGYLPDPGKVEASAYQPFPLVNNLF